MTNPNSTVDMLTVVHDIIEKERFQRLYIYFETLKRSCSLSTQLG